MQGANGLRNPSGTVTLLFTDIEGSTGLWESDPEAMRTALERHVSILRSAIDGHGGYVFSTGGDGFAAAFTRALDALQAAIDAQAALADEAWPDGARLRVRMGLHTGEVEEREVDYFGRAVNRAARLMAAAHGGQVVCSAVTASLAAGQLPEGTSLVELGRHRLRDLSEPELVFQLAHPALRSDCPPLRSLDNYPGNLPIQPTSFVGRSAQLAELSKALAETRILTLWEGIIPLTWSGRETTSGVTSSASRDSSDLSRKKSRMLCCIVVPGRWGTPSAEATASSIVSALLTAASSTNRMLNQAIEVRCDNQSDPALCYEPSETSMSIGGLNGITAGHGGIEVLIQKELA